MAMTDKRQALITGANKGIAAVDGAMLVVRAFDDPGR